MEEAIDESPSHHHGGANDKQGERLVEGRIRIAEMKDHPKGHRQGEEGGKVADRSNIAAGIGTKKAGEDDQERGDSHPND